MKRKIVPLLIVEEWEFEKRDGPARKRARNLKKEDQID